MQTFQFRQKLPLLFWATLMMLVFGETVLLGLANWQNEDAPEWNGDEAHRVLQKSPWSKSTRLNCASTSPDPEVTVRWQSALPVRLALSKAAGGHPYAARMEALNVYVIAVSGVPSKALPLLGLDMFEKERLSQTPAAIENDLRLSTSLVPGRRQAIHPEKVEISPAGDERVMLFYFSRHSAIRLSDRQVEFRLSTGRTEVKRKFALKEMQYQGKLEL